MKVSQKEVSQKKNSKKKVSQRKVSQRKVSQRKVSQKKVSQKKVSWRKVSWRKVSQRRVQGGLTEGLKEAAAWIFRDFPGLCRVLQLFAVNNLTPLGSHPLYFSVTEPIFLPQKTPPETSSFPVKNSSP